MEFETVDYTDEMVIVEKKNNGNKEQTKKERGKKGTTAIEAHYSQLQCHIYIFICKLYIYIYALYIYIKYNTSIIYTATACFPSVALESL